MAFFRGWSRIGKKLGFAVTDRNIELYLLKFVIQTVSCQKFFQFSIFLPMTVCCFDSSAWSWPNKPLMESCLSRAFWPSSASWASTDTFCACASGITSTFIAARAVRPLSTRLGAGAGTVGETPELVRWNFCVVFETDWKRSCFQYRRGAFRGHRYSTLFNHRQWRFNSGKPQVIMPPSAMVDEKFLRPQSKCGVASTCGAVVFRDLSYRIL